MDFQYLFLLQNFREATHGIFNSFFLMMTAFGGAITYLIPPAIFWCLDKEFGTRAMFVFHGGRMLNGVLKLTACVYRPWIRWEEIHPLEKAIGGATGYSFPSGHSTSATAAYGSIAWEYRKKHRVLAFFLFLIVLLVMLSRNYVGVHTPQDVLVGFGVTMILVLVSRQIMEWVENGKNRDVMLSVILMAVTVGLMVWFLLKAYPMDYDAAGELIVDPAAMRVDSFAAAGAWVGFLLGWMIQRRYIDFTTEVGGAVRIFRFVTGAAVLVIIKAGGGSLLQSAGVGKIWAEFLQMLVLLLYCMAVHPLLFTAAEKKCRL